MWLVSVSQFLGCLVVDIRLFLANELYIYHVSTGTEIHEVIGKIVFLTLFIMLWNDCVQNSLRSKIAPLAKMNVDRQILLGMSVWTQPI